MMSPQSYADWSSQLVAGRKAGQGVVLEGWWECEFTLMHNDLYGVRTNITIPNVFEPILSLFFPQLVTREVRL